MALDAERSEQRPLSNGFAGLKGFANDIRAAAAAGTRRLAQSSSARAGSTTQSLKAAATSAADASQSAARMATGAVRRTASAIALGAQSAAARVEQGAEPPKALAPLQAWFARQPIVRFFSASLLRRILISNLMGFFILVGGILYLGWFHTWLIDAKLDALKTQGKIIADAIAANAKVIRESIVIDPNAIPDANGNTQSRFTDDGLTSLELSIHPEEVTPILRKLIQPTNTRARIYGRDGTLIVDTAQTLARWKAMRNEPTRQRRRVAGNAEHLVAPYALFLPRDAAGLPGDRHRQRHGLQRSARRARGRGEEHAAAQPQGRADRVHRPAHSPLRRRAGRAAAVDAPRSDRQDPQGRAHRHPRARRRLRCWHRWSPRCCWRAPSPAPCAAYRPPPSASATTSMRARSYRNIRAAPTRWRRWRTPSTP